MQGLRTPSTIVSLALKMRTEGMGIRTAGRVLQKSHSTIIRWEKRVAAKESDWTVAAPKTADVTHEGDEIYTRYALHITVL
jgi:transposase